METGNSSDRLTCDVFWSFRSPYSYLATARLVGIERRYDLDLRVRPVLPIAVRIPGFFDRVNPLWPPYLLRDCMRIAEYHGIDFGWPRPDPIVQDFMTRKVAEEQPYIHRMTRLGQLAAERAVVGKQGGKHVASAQKARDEQLNREWQLTLEA